MSNPRYPEEFKIEAAKQAVFFKVADVDAQGLYAWGKCYNKLARTDQQAELLHLCAELKRVTRDILKNCLPGAPQPAGLETRPLH